ncbi:cytochrome b [Acetobacter cerevisiae]|uniref:Cytochrome B n=1 Tax=Acetobacter cerevisiae TaxID=178900 RepID=A0A149QXM1_9PROT|nr:cytochrome b/b6 domain-containing protein [Acetobacter cerevisiae]KXV02059.1 cytochrome B [Acetobacter cerevisiae]GBQ08218.1 cytochrome B561 [Acetobacter cerevisiae DSM 14362]
MSRAKSFSLPSRVLHWLMAAMILIMLFIGVFMASTVGPNYDRLVALHRPLGIAILALALLRLANRLRSPPPPLPEELPPTMKIGAKASHLLLYALMIAMPLVGWGMMSAGGYPILLWGRSMLLPPILPHDPTLWAWLRSVHTVLAFLLFGLVLAHIGAAMFHGFIRRDGVLQSMIFTQKSAKG